MSFLKDMEAVLNEDYNNSTTDFLKRKHDKFTSLAV